MLSPHDMGIVAMGATIVAIAVALVLYNGKQAVSGWRQMRRLDRRHKETQTAFANSQRLLEEFTALKREFDTQAQTHRLTAEERSRLWKPVDEAIARSVDALLTGNGPQGDAQIRAAIAEAQRVLAPLKAA